jgi:hypothetical protein
MNRTLCFWVAVFSLGVLYFAGMAKADDNPAEVIIPAGTLLRCTLDEPNFSTKSADVGDPVICHLREAVLFDRPLFPRGAYLGGHLESEKEPGHFVGKGYLHLEFDKIGFPEGQIPVAAKVISAKGYHVDRQGKIIGHGHPVRDAVEWMIPPLWPEKVVTLPARGPHPTLKGEEQLTLRVMDDIAVPAQPMLGWHYFKRSSLNQAYGSQNWYVPAKSAQTQQPTRGVMFATAAMSAVRSDTTASVSGGTDNAKANLEPAAYVQTIPPNGPARTTGMNVLVLRNGSTCVGNGLRLHNGQVDYSRADGSAATVASTEVDWIKTLEQNKQDGIPLRLSSAGR